VTEELHTHEERCRAVFQAANDAIFLMNDDRFVDCNPKTLEIFGCEREQIVGQPPWRFSPPEQPDGRPSREAALERIRAAQREGPQFFEWRHQRLDGTPFEAEVSLTALELETEPHILAIVRDVTERKRAVEELRRSRELYSKTFEESPTAIVLSTLAEGRILNANRGFKRIFGIDPADAIGKTSLELEIWYSADDRADMIERMTRDGVVATRAYRFNAWDGSVGIGLFSAEIIELEGETCLVSTTEDITEMVQTEARLRSYQRDLREMAARLAIAEERERRRIAVDLHDTAAQNLALATMKLRGLEEASPGVEACAALTSVRELIEQTAAGLRTLSIDLSPPSLYEVGLAAALESAVRRFADTNGIACSLDDDGSAEQLEEMLRVTLYRCATELLANVAKHSGATEARVTLRQAEESVEVCVTDNGRGFERAPEGAGAGLGLFSVRERLETLGGELRIGRSVEGGAEVTITAPLDSDRRGKDR